MGSHLAQTIRVLRLGLLLHTRKSTSEGIRCWMTDLTNRLTHGAFVLVSGRIGAVYGHKNILLVGGVWWILWSLINGFSTSSLVTFALARGFSGIGAALVMPNAVAVIGTTFPPGRMRNLSFGFFGFAAPVAGTLGCIVIGLFVEFAEWKWFFFFA